MKARTILIFAFIFLLWASPVLAQNSDAFPETIEGLVVSLYNGSVRVVGLAAFLMILYAGVLRLVGRGSESNQVILDAVVGTILLLSSVVILNSINPDLTQQGPMFRQTNTQRGGATAPNPGGTQTLPTGAILPIVIQ